MDQLAIDDISEHASPPSPSLLHIIENPMDLHEQPMRPLMYSNVLARGGFVGVESYKLSFNKIWLYADVLVLTIL